MSAFLRGMARIVDLFGAIRNPSVDYILARKDADAIGQDWLAVEESLKRAWGEAMCGDTMSIDEMWQEFDDDADDAPPDSED